MRTRAWRRQQRSKRIEHWRRILQNSWRVYYRWVPPVTHKYPSIRIWASFMAKSHRNATRFPKYRELRHLEPKQAIVRLPRKRTPEPNESQDTYSRDWFLKARK